MLAILWESCGQQAPTATRNNDTPKPEYHPHPVIYSVLHSLSEKNTSEGKPADHIFHRASITYIGQGPPWRKLYIWMMACRLNFNRACDTAQINRDW